MQDKFEFKTPSGTKNIHMTFGLLNLLCRVVGELDGTALMALDNDMRHKLLVELLSPRDSEGNITAQTNPDTIESSVETVSDLLFWAQEHLFDFFVKAATKSKAAAEKHRLQLDSLRVSSAGGVGTQPKKQSA